MDQRISDPVEIAVSADGGTVSLRGTVGSFGERRAAVKDARNVEGVYDVIDELQVRLLDEYRREDSEIRGAALQILMWDIEVPAELIDVKVEDGWVTLKGGADFQFQSDAAFDDVATLYGVVGITNEIRVTTP
jgi:osmotically-inducible protein OsmY